MRKYKKRVEPEKFQYVPEMINRRFNSPEPEPIVHMAVCHRIAYDQVDYHHSGSKVHNSDEMLDRLSGDCQDHSVLVATLLKACGLDVSLVRLSRKNSSSGHVLPEVRNPLPSIEETCDSLRRFYWNQFDIFAEEIGYERYRGDHWIVADTAGDMNAGWSKYLGDISSHTDKYIERQRGGDWEWWKIRSRFEV